MSHSDTLAAPTSSPDAQFESLLRRNAEYADYGFVPGLKMMPAGRTLILGCVDPRVDPMDIFKLAPGEAAVIRNVGGRVNPALVETLGLLRVVSQSVGANLGAATNLVLLQHTDCGIKHCNHDARDCCRATWASRPRRSTTCWPSTTRTPRWPTTSPR